MFDLNVGDDFGVVAVVCLLNGFVLAFTYNNTACMEDARLKSLRIPLLSAKKGEEVKKPKGLYPEAQMYGIAINNTFFLFFFLVVGFWLVPKFPAGLMVPKFQFSLSTLLPSLLMAGIPLVLSS